ncbi:MAG: YjbQ family protein [bacterium]|nr:YjbQ family protein [bacterium]
MKRKSKKNPEFEELNFGLDDLKDTDIPGVKFLDITEAVNRVVKEWSIKTGVVVIQTKHTTTGVVEILVQENEEGLVMHDIPQYYIKEKVRPEWERLRKRKYQHDNWKRIKALGGKEPRNGARHLLAASLTKPSLKKDLPLNVHKGALDLGTWQSVLLFVDFDAAPHHPGRRIGIVVKREAQ